jgi:hypothetical protein
MKKKYRNASILVLFTSVLSSCALWPLDNASVKENPHPRTARDPLLPVKRVVVIPFMNRTPYGGNSLADYATDTVKEQVRHLEELTLVPEALLENADAVYTDSKSLEFKDLVERAASVDVSAIIFGTIENIETEDKGEDVGIFRQRKVKTMATVHLQVFDVRNSRFLISKTVDADAIEENLDFLIDRDLTGFSLDRAKAAVFCALEKVFGELSSFAHRIDWSGRIAKVDVDRYYINGGELTGISKGQLLQVFEEGQPITDPENNQVVGLAPGRFKGYLKIIDLFGEDGAVGVVQTGGGFKEKDRLRVVSSAR